MDSPLRRVLKAGIFTNQHFESLPDADQLKGMNGKEAPCQICQALEFPERCHMGYMSCPRDRGRHTEGWEQRENVTTAQIVL